jgi:hypothetical protein
MKSDKIDEFIMHNIGQYWDSSEDLADALKEKFGDDIYNDEEWLSIARSGIDCHYS